MVQVAVDDGREADVGVLMETPLCRRRNCVDCAPAQNKVRELVELAETAEGRESRIYGFVACAIQWGRTTVRMNCGVFGEDEVTIIQERSRVFCPG